MRNRILMEVNTENEDILQTLITDLEKSKSVVSVDAYDIEASACLPKAKLLVDILEDMIDTSPEEDVLAEDKDLEEFYAEVQNMYEALKNIPANKLP